ncbi:MAG: orotate phosphoribosyltransferase [Acidobacteriaceae bacterium]|nr:orotate phosphoribosyltransferase [Acidobacteriaceae bacterium]
MSESILELFEGTGAYLRGHFRLTSGLHSGEYLQCAKVLAFPDYAEQLGKLLAAKISAWLGEARPQTVVSPAMGGIIIGHEVARALRARAIFMERDPDFNQMTLRRGFEVAPGEEIIVIEDVITTGGSTKEVVRAMRALEGKVFAAGSIIDRSGGTADVSVPHVSLESLHPMTYAPDECPLCSAGIPVVKPGSRRT